MGRIVKKDARVIGAQIASIQLMFTCLAGADTKNPNYLKGLRYLAELREFVEDHSGQEIHIKEVK